VAELSDHAFFHSGSCSEYALIYPPLFTWFGNEWITWGLAVHQLAWVITLSVDYFKGVMKTPGGFGPLRGNISSSFLGWAVARRI